MPRIAYVLRIFKKIGGAQKDFLNEYLWPHLLYNVFLVSFCFTSFPHFVLSTSANFSKFLTCLYFYFIVVMVGDGKRKLMIGPRLV